MISTGQVTGRWKNSKTTTNGIAEFTLVEKGDKLSISIKAAEDGFLPVNMNDIEAIAHAANTSSSECVAFHAETTINEKSYFFAGNVNKGLVIIATYVKVDSDDGENYFLREFFYKLK